MSSLRDTIKEIFETRYASRRDWYVNQIIDEVAAVYLLTLRYVERADGGVEDWSADLRQIYRTKIISYLQSRKDEDGLREFFPLVRDEDEEDPEDNPGGPPWTPARLSTPDEEEAYGRNRRRKSVRDGNIASGHIERAQRRRRQERRQEQDQDDEA